MIAISAGGTITTAAISHDGNMVALADDLMNLYIYEITSGKIKQQRLIQEAFPGIKCITWNHDDSLVLIGGDSRGGIGGRVL